MKRNEELVIEIDVDPDGCGLFEEVVIPSRYEVCPTCEGRGSHVNPSIDGNGLTAEDFAEDPDFAESYFRGDYDVSCYECKGARVILVPDYDRMDAKLRAQVEKWEQERAEFAAEEAYYRRCRERGMEF